MIGIITFVSLQATLTPINQQTGLPDETAQKTTSYVDAIILEDKVVAWLEEYTEGLVPSDYVPEKPNQAQSWGIVEKGIND